MTRRVAVVADANSFCRITADARVTRSASRYFRPVMKVMLPAEALSIEAIEVIAVSPSPSNSAPIEVAISLQLRPRLEETEVTPAGSVILLLSGNCLLQLQQYLVSDVYCLIRK